MKPVKNELNQIAKFFKMTLFCAKELNKSYYEYFLVDNSYTPTNPDVYKAKKYGAPQDVISAIDITLIGYFGLLDSSGNFIDLREVEDIHKYISPLPSYYDTDSFDSTIYS
jgi:hypothetical protein